MRGTIQTWLLIVWIAAVANSCSHSSQRNNKTADGRPDATQKSYKKPAAASMDTMVITGKSAVFYSPDSLQWKQLTQMVTTDEYESEMHNCFYLTQNAINVTRKYYQHVQITKASSVRYLLFIKDNDQQSICIDLDSKELCGAFLFDGEKDPEFTDMMNIDTALGFYFGG